MKKALILLVLFLTGCVGSVDNNKVIELENKVKHLTTNTLVSRYEDGKLVYEENYIDNQKVVKNYLYKLDKLDRVVTYDSEGNVVSKEWFNTDKKYWYNKNGNIIYGEQYSYNDNSETLNKIVTFYSDNGEVLKTETFSNDKLLKQTLYDSGQKIMMTSYEQDSTIYTEYYRRDGSIDYAQWFDNGQVVHEMRPLDNLNKETYKHSYYINNSVVKEEIISRINNTKEIYKYSDGILISKEIFEDNRLSLKSTYETINRNKVITTREYGIYLQKEQLEKYYNNVITKKVLKYYDLGKLSDSNITYYNKEGIKTRLEYYNEFNELSLVYHYNNNGIIISTEEYSTE